MASLSVTDDDFAPLRDAAAAPEALELDGCDLDAHAPPRPLGGLRELTIGDDCNMSRDGLRRWLDACPDLATLDVEGQDLGAVSFADLPPRLTHLHVRGGRLERLTDPPAASGLQVLELTACGLRDVALPGSATSLRALSFAHNPDLGRCPDLPWAAKAFALDLRGTGLDAWPTPAGRDKVAHLDVCDNRLGVVPDGVGDWTSVEAVRAEGCSIASIDAALASCRHLHTLRLKHNPLRALPAAIPALPALRVLDLRGCGLAAFPTGLADVATLESLDLSENDLGAIAAPLDRLARLRSLQLWKCGLRALPSLRGLAALEQLELGYNPLTALPDLRGPKALRFLGLAGLRQLDWQAAFDRLAELPHLVHASFTNNDFPDLDERVLTIPGLQRVDVNKTRVPAARYEELRRAHPGVTIWGG